MERKNYKKTGPFDRTLFLFGGCEHGTKLERIFYVNYPLKITRYKVNDTLMNSRI